MRIRRPKTVIHPPRLALGPQDEPAAEPVPMLWNGELQDLSVQWLPIETLIPAKRRVRRPDPAQVQRIAGSIKEFGVCLPVLIGERSEIIDGHSTVEALRLLGQRKVPVISVAGMSEFDIRRLRLAIMAIQDNAQIDRSAVRIELCELVLECPELIIPGFDAEVIEAMVASGSDDGGDEEPSPTPGGQATTCTGDVWLLGPHKQVCGDSLDASVVGPLMDLQAAAIITDPPFNVPVAGHVSRNGHREFQMASGEMTRDQYKQFLARSARICVQHLRPGGLVYCFMDWRSVAILQAAAESEGLHLFQWAVWAKTNPGMGSYYRSQHEFCLIFKYGTAPHVNNIMLGKNGRSRTNVWNYPGVTSLHSEAREVHAEHPTPKPVQMVRDIMLDCTRKGQVVFDPYAGSGTTLIAADGLGRIYRGVEIDPLYVDLIVRRWAQATGNTPVLASTGETFETVARRRLNEAKNRGPVTGLRVKRG